MPTVPVPGPDGYENMPIDDLTQWERSTLAEYFNAVGKVLSNQDPYAALDFEGIEIAGRRLPTDPYEIIELERSGVWEEDFYKVER